MPDPEKLFQGIASGKTREQITADEMSDSLRDIARSVEHHVDIADQSARDAAASAASSEHYAKSANLRGWISLGFSFISVLISIGAFVLSILNYLK